jgi:uncharacterized membrane protein
LAIDPGTYYASAVITALVVMIFFILVLSFLYMLWGRRETGTTETKPKP